MYPEEFTNLVQVGTIAVPITEADFNTVPTL